MLKFRPKTWNWICALAILCPMALSAAEDIQSSDPSEATTPGYIRDNLFIYMHAGAGKRFRILGSVNAGTAVEKLDEDSESGFVKIQDDKGRIGWVEGGNFTEEPSIAIKLEQLQQENQQLRAQLDESLQTRDQAVLALDSAQQASNDFSKTVAKLEEEKLQLQSQIDKFEGDKDQKTLLYGAGILFGGLIFGLILPALMPRRRRQDNWL